MGSASAVAAGLSTTRKRALTMVCGLHRDSEAVRRGRSLVMWCPVKMIVKRPVDADVLAFATAQGWIELSPNADMVRVTDEGSRLVK